MVDHKGRSHNSNSTITLRWYYDSGMQTFQETFYIVDKLTRPEGGEWDAMLRHGIEPSPEHSAPQAHPYFTSTTSRKTTKADDDRERERLKKYEAEKAEQARKIRETLAKKQATKR